MRILLVDDDLDTHDVISTYLNANGFEVGSAYSGSEGIEYLQEHPVDLMILDIELPVIDGWDVCRQVRTISNIPILLISAVARDDHDIMRGLTIGADDYLLKPIHLGVLKAHIYALLRRSVSSNQNNRLYGYLDFHLMIDLHREEVRVNNQRVALSFLEYRLLELLVINIDITVPTLEIIEQLWSENVDDGYMRYVRIYIQRLRETIEPDPHKPIYIITEHGYGYRFCKAGRHI